MKQDHNNRSEATRKDRELGEEQLDRVSGGFNPQPEPPASTRPLNGTNEALGSRVRSRVRLFRR